MSTPRPLALRPLVLLGTLLAVGACAPTPETPVPQAPPPSPDAPVNALEKAEQVIAETMRDSHVPGIAAAVVKDGAVAWAQGFGMADVENGVPMTPETVLNVASISKTVVNAAVLQLVERGQVGLDDDVNRHLSFQVVHPRHPETPITLRHLLTHTSGIADGPAYDDSYACGDPKVSLANWIRGALLPQGRYYDEDESFHASAPGETYHYSNVGYGLLGLLVEEVSGQPFDEYTRQNVFEPLGMNDTAWHLADLPDGVQHAVPYVYLRAGAPRTQELLAQRGFEPMSEDGLEALCLYSFYNYPDGLVRTSVRDLSRFLLAHMGDGAFGEGRILAPETVELIWTAETSRNRVGDEEVQGLTWNGREREGIGFAWGHSGSDPGVTTHMYFAPERNVGVLVFANAGAGIAPITRALFAAAEELGS